MNQQRQEVLALVLDQGRKRACREEEGYIPGMPPSAGKSEPKTPFYEKVGSDVCGVGVYKPQT